MKTLIVYSTISGNTKSVCERIYGALNTEKEIRNVKDIKNLQVNNYDNFIIGFGVIKELWIKILLIF